MIEVAWLIPALPLLGFICLVLFGRRLGEPAAGWLATLASAGAFVFTLVTFVGLVGREADDRFEIIKLFTWLDVGSFQVDAGLLVDPLSITMCLFVTGVGTLIHLYSIGYMHGDENFSKFFIYLNLFIGSMILLVLGDNLLITFLGWEGVGACSYLLISFWFGDESNASAGKKAFVTNRIGDFGYMLATFLVFVSLGSINYDDILTRAGELSSGTATALVLLFLLAASGKSAQLPLFVWLPDAMAGPTPVSALIHAATMVTSGVFLLTRLNPVLAQADLWSTGLVAWVGAITALVAATIAVAQNDIKKVLAYSTVSQLGYLFLAVGVGAYVPAMFHMITHAFFKALLFLGSGSVIHGLDDEQDMRRMGGVANFMPITAITFIIGWLAIAGVPPFSGFWSKDEILLYAWNADAVGGKALWVIGLVTALLTAFYMTRQVVLTFFGRTRFFDVRPEELTAAWANRVDGARLAVDEAKEGETAAAAGVDKAKAEVAKKQEAVVKAQDKLADAQRKVDESSDADDGHEKLVKALAKAEAGVPKAEDAVVKAEAKVSEATSDMQDAMVNVRSAESQVATVEGRRPHRSDGGHHVTALTAAPDAGELGDNLPDSYHRRQEYHPHESPLTMTLPLIVLAVLAVFAGGLNLPFTKELHFLEHWLEPSLFGNEVHVTATAGTKIVLAVIAVLVGAVAIVAAFSMYMRGRGSPATVERSILAQGWGIDRSYASFFGGPGRRFFDLLTSFDRTVVDGAVGGIASLCTRVGTVFRGLQPGFVRSYALSIGLGSVLVMVWFLGALF